MPGAVVTAAADAVVNGPGLREATRGAEDAEEEGLGGGDEDNDDDRGGGRGGDEEEETEVQRGGMMGAAFERVCRPGRRSAGADTPEDGSEVDTVQK